MAHQMYQKSFVTHRRRVTITRRRVSDVGTKQRRVIDVHVSIKPKYYYLIIIYYNSILYNYVF